MRRLKINVVEDTPRCIIGEASEEAMWKAAIREYHVGVCPLVKPGFKDNKCNKMETYAKMLTQYAMQKAGYGTIEFNADGCKSDLIFIGKESDLVLGIQIKTTAKMSTTSGRKGWRFFMRSGYHGLLILFKCLETGECWIIAYNEFCDDYTDNKLRIPYTGNGRNIDWNNYKVNNSEVPNKINEYFLKGVKGDPNICLQKIEDIKIPVAQSTQKEHTSRNKIIPYLKKTGLPITFSLIEDQVYDFILGDLKIQEKNAQLNPYGTGFFVGLTTKKDNKVVAYHEKDVDIFLIHIGDAIYFIPTIALVKQGYISTDKQKGKGALTLYPDENLETNPNLVLWHNWPIEYLLPLNDPNFIDRMMFIYNMQLNKKLVPIVLKKPLYWDINCFTFTEIVFRDNIERTYVTSDESYNFEMYGKRILERNCLINNIGCRIDLRYKSENQYIKIGYNKFDFFFSPLYGEYKDYFLFVPAKLMEENGIITKDKLASQVMFPLPDDPKTNHNRHWWVKDFYYRFSDRDVIKKIIKILHSY